MKLCPAVFAFAMIASPAIADDIPCELAWFTRNLIFDRAGYCFASPLGQTLFDNADCTGTDIALSERDRDGVDQIIEYETYSACSVDTQATHLEHLSELEHLRQFEVIPIPTEGESGCSGYLGTALPLLSRPGQGRMTGQLVPGDSILFGSQAEGAWDFVSVYRDGWHNSDVLHGWVYFGGDFPVCQHYAG